ncbi:MAG: glycosyltransferase family 39 protein [Chloroflexota bacterium]
MTRGLARLVPGERVGRGVGRATPWLGFALVVVLAAVARWPGLDTYVTIDESRWVQRAGNFYALIQQRDYEDTFIIGHPGVTTMWLAWVGMGPERALAFSFREGQTDATRREGYFDALIASRQPFVAVAVIGLVLIVALAWRLVGPGGALVAGGLMALEPFLIAHARVVHLDSNLTVFTSLTLLCGLLFWRERRWPYLAASGVFGGLAFLTKAPSVFVLGFVPLVFLVSLLRPRRKAVSAWIETAGWLALWGGLIVAVCLVLWPSFRVSPVGTVVKMIQFTERVGGGEHDNFFWGVAREDPGPLFYPLALLYRLSPLTLIGLLLVPASWRQIRPEARLLLGVLGLYVLGFMLMMSTAPKKFDRYLLPVFPALAIVAGTAMFPVASRIVWWTGLTRGMTLLALTVSMLALHAAPLLRVHPYHLAYYNPLLGGGAAAQRLILVGWGEGLDQVASYLNGQTTGLGESTVATSYHRVLQAQLQGSALPLDRIRMADYVVPYVNTLQRGAERDVLEPIMEMQQPEYVVRLNGIEYARVYRGPHYPTMLTPNTQVGPGATLREVLVAPGSGAVKGGDEILVLLRWEAGLPEGGLSRLTLQDAAGRGVAQDQRPLGGDGPDVRGLPGDRHVLMVPARTPRGQYDVVAAFAGLPGGAAPEPMKLARVVVE